ncbi:MAG: putative metalloprotease CJM1_0395 family protein, partial [Dethiobacteria bacterium]|nr:putative metalloprotease CJM1_0395 family protein [Dethiobacteria bacterium]
ALKQAAADDELNTEEQREVQQLRARDREVRAHEQAHVAASGSIGVSGPRYSYEDGPDGKRYAVGGSVNFQVPPANSPAEEIRLAAQLRRMALAPANPSGTDRAVAAEASRKEAQARRELQQENMEKTETMRDSDTVGKTELRPFVVSDSGSDINSIDFLNKNKPAHAAYANASATDLLQYKFSVNFSA